MHGETKEHIVRQTNACWDKWKYMMVKWVFGEKSECFAEANEYLVNQGKIDEWILLEVRECLVRLFKCILKQVTDAS